MPQLQNYDEDPATSGRPWVRTIWPDGGPGESPQLVGATIMKHETVAPPPKDASRLPFLSKLLEQRERLHWMGVDKEEEKV